MLRSCSESSLKTSSQLVQYKSVAKNDPSNWVANLPIELVSQIFSYLTFDDVVAASVVCKSWNYVLNDDRFLRSILNKYFFDSKGDLENKIAMNNQDSLRGYENLFRGLSEDQFNSFKKGFYSVIDSSTAKKLVFYSSIIDKIKSLNFKRKKIDEIKNHANRLTVLEILVKKIKTVKTENKITLLDSLLNVKSVNEIRERIEALAQQLNDQFENLFINFMKIYIDDPNTIFYMNLVNFSGFEAEPIISDERLLEWINLGFSDQGKVLFLIMEERLKHLISKTDINKEKITFVDLLKDALDIYSRKKKIGRKRQAPESE